MENISVFEKNKHLDLITNLDFVKMQHCRHMERIWIVHQHDVGRFVGQAAQARPAGAMLLRDRSLLGQSSRYLAMMTRPELTNFLRHNLWLYYSFQSMISWFHQHPIIRLLQIDMPWITD